MTTIHEELYCWAIYPFEAILGIEWNMHGEAMRINQFSVLLSLFLRSWHSTRRHNSTELVVPNVVTQNHHELGVGAMSSKVFASLADCTIIISKQAIFNLSFSSGSLTHRCYKSL